MSSSISISVLGPPSITYDNEPWAIPRLQNRALLFRLATQAEPISRDHLAFLFWPDVASSKARRHLTQLLSHVRGAMPEPNIILTTRSHVQFDQTRVWSDATAFTRLSAQLNNANLDNLQQAIALYQGSLLDGVSLPKHPEYEMWLMGERSRLERLYLDGLDRLAAHFLAHKEYQQAIDMTKRYLAIDELAEEAHRRLIECFGAIGDRSAATKQYEECVLVLERDLGVEPLPETEAAYQAVLAGGPLSNDKPYRPALVSLPGPDIPLVGREDLLEKLTFVFQRLQAGQGNVILLAGEAGSGKSRLVQEFARQVAADALILSAACYRSTRSIPYQPIVEALRPALNSAYMIPKISSSWLGIATSLFPELADLHPNLALSVDSVPPQQTQGHLFEALRLLILGLASQEMPVLLCLDDLEWADAMTLTWLAFLAQELAHNAVLVIGTCRSVEANELAGLRQELSRQRIITECHLAPLDKGQVNKLISHFDIAVDDQMPASLLKATGGNPFYLVEMLQQMYEQGQAGTVVDWRELPLPTDVRETVERRLGRVQPIARQVMEAAAIWGQAFSFQDIQQTSGRNENETADALEELISRNLIVEESEGFRFHNEITMTVIDQGLHTWRRQLLHKRAGEMLVQEIPVDQGPERAAIAARIGQHFVASGDGKRAVDYLLEAGDHARIMYDHGSALDHYQQALVFMEQHEEPALAARTLMKVSFTHHLALHFEEARTTLEQGLQLWQRSGYISEGRAGVPAPHQLRIVWPAVPRLLDSTKVDDFYSRNLIGQLFSGLVRLTPELDIVPDVAQGWDIEDNGKRYVFHLRDDVRWSDGRPVTAHDFEYAWKRVLDPVTGSPAADALYDICNAVAYHTGKITDPDELGIRSLDSRTLVIEITEPTSYFLYLLTHTACFPVPRHITSSGSMDSIHGEGFVSNGPFVLETHNVDGATILRRNSNYHNPSLGNVEQVELRALKDRHTIWAMYQADELDVIMFYYPPAEDTERMRWRYAADYISIPAMKTDFVTFDTSRPPFDDVQVRQAFAQSIDRQKLADKVMRGYAAPAKGGFIPPGMPGHSLGVGTPFDPVRARRLFDAAGYPDSSQFPPVEWLTPKGFESVSTFLQRQWQTHLGLSIEFQALPWDTFTERLALDPPQMLVVTWRADYPDPDSLLRAGPAQHFAAWNDEVYGWLLDDARQTTDLEERMAICRQMDRMLAEEAVILPLTYGRDHLLVKPWIKLLPTSPINWWYWQEIVIENH